MTHVYIQSLWNALNFLHKALSLSIRIYLIHTYEDSFQNCTNKWGKETKQSTWVRRKNPSCDWLNDWIIFFSHSCISVWSFWGDLDTAEPNPFISGTSLEANFKLLKSFWGRPTRRRPWWSLLGAECMVSSLMSVWTHEKGAEQFWQTKVVS